MYNAELHTAIFYTCGTCNLKCRYCGIDKNPVLGEIDKALGESFNGDYYFNQVKKYFPNKLQLKRIETWGGEPFWHMERIYPLVHQLIGYYPYFDSFYSSTNFSYPAWMEKITGLFEVFGQYPYRKFNFYLQLSVDGPEYINDAGRGEGVTKRCIENFDKLMAWLPGNLPENIHLDIFIKGTLDNNSIKALNDKDKLIEYYQFFEENFIDKVRKLKMKNVVMNPSIPNTAVPSPVTKEEGQIFANLCKLCREIEYENNSYKYFRYYDIITPFNSDIKQTHLGYDYNYHTCGTCTSMMGFLPNNMISTCHEGFTQFCDEYQKYAATSDRVNHAAITFDKFIGDDRLKLCVSEDRYADIKKVMENYCAAGTTARLSNIALLIRVLAMSGQIEEKFATEENALKAAIFIQSHTAYCIKDNYNKTGSFSMVPVGTLKLLLNGAMFYIQGEGELRV